MFLWAQTFLECGNIWQIENYAIDVNFKVLPCSHSHIRTVFLVNSDYTILFFLRIFANTIATVSWFQFSMDSTNAFNGFGKRFRIDRRFFFAQHVDKCFFATPDILKMFQ